MKGTVEQLLRAFKPLGEYKLKAGQYAFNCPRCEKELGNPIDKYNLELNYDKSACHCWSCGLSGIKNVIEKYGYAEFAPLFDTSNKKNIEIEKTNHLFLPDNLSTVYNYKEVFDYLKNRGLTTQIIKERGIKYCYEGFYKNNIIFPSYNKNNELTAFVSQNFSTKKYKKHLSKNFICFYENFINKNSLIIPTEGVYDCLVVPNSFPLLGTEISEEILYFLTDTDVLLILDGDVNEILIEQKTKQLKSTCKSVSNLTLTEKQQDLNYFYIKNPSLLKQKLLPFYFNKE